jgi:RNA polymerase sigma-70 factor (ECF subfamily)
MSPVVAFKPAIAPLGQDIEALFLEHSRMVYRTAYSVTGTVPDAEDVVQTLFLQLLRHGLPPDLKTTTAAYLYRAAVNSSLNIVKSRQRRAAAADAARFEFPTIVSADQDRSAVDVGRRRQLAEAIATLKPRAVEMLILRYAHDQSEADIARLLGTSRSVVAVTLFRARARLKTLLPKPGDQS